MNTLRIDTATGQNTLEDLREMQVGEAWNYPLFPGIDTPVVWTLAAREDKYWRFEGTFLGIPFKRVEVNLVANQLYFTEMTKEAA